MEEVGIKMAPGDPEATLHVYDEDTGLSFFFPVLEQYQKDVAAGVLTQGRVQIYLRGLPGELPGRLRRWAQYIEDAENAARALP